LVAGESVITSPHNVVSWRRIWFLTWKLLPLSSFFSVQYQRQPVSQYRYFSRKREILAHNR